MKPRLKLSSRYAIDVETIGVTTSVEFPKAVSRERVMRRAWTWFNGNGASRIPVFADALSKAWKSEIGMIKEGGCIYHPYIMSEPLKPMI